MKYFVLGSIELRQSDGDQVFFRLESGRKTQIFFFLREKVVCVYANLSWAFRLKKHVCICIGLLNIAYRKLLLAFKNVFVLKSFSVKKEILAKTHPN